MTRADALDLAKRIPKEATDKVTVKIGCTNGEHLIHLIETVERTDGEPGKTRVSTDLTKAVDWDLHPLNRRNRPPKPSKKGERTADLASEDDVREALDTIYDPEEDNA